MGRGPIYLFAILATAVMASGYVIGGLLAGASGFTSVLLAAAVPVAAISWAITVSTLQRDHDGGAERREPWPDDQGRDGYRPRGQRVDRS